ncbi:flagellar biosynthetic protein FliQ [Anaerobranca californiensis DSM 14826]|jgi:flagellar biosynthetic protein FliQ|uniref:Flagellar biosynthetic protein FliQ n=1 Tax=Anaerobranca californiensis DSM 14826 TaxID=1120989 RepID=A0A1M6KHY9_9FIRM|nr:flagellar biosynthesis protein FliQ [Anaerobranca californiensis]SHJ58521.1 flagellar biosynthetic protein FliQ [Anaerobranca californiensis DSM 14826]
MSPDFIIDLGKEALMMILLLAAPMLGIGLAVGLLISIFQATTQIQEQTLTFIPKIIAVLLSILFFGPWMLNLIVDFTVNLFTNIPNIIGM